MRTYIIKFEVYYHFSGISFISEVNFWRPPITVDSFDLFILIIMIIIIFFIRVFSECTEAITTSLIPLVTNFPELRFVLLSLALALLCGLK